MVRAGPRIAGRLRRWCNSGRMHQRYRRSIGGSRRLHVGDRTTPTLAGARRETNRTSERPLDRGRKAAARNDGSPQGLPGAVRFHSECCVRRGKQLIDEVQHAAQNPAQYVHVSARTQREAQGHSTKYTTQYDRTPNSTIERVGPEGFEQTPEDTEKNGVFENGSEERSIFVATRCAASDSRPLTLAECWDTMLAPALEACPDETIAARIRAAAMQSERPAEISGAPGGGFHPETTVRRNW